MPTWWLKSAAVPLAIPFRRIARHDRSGGRRSLRPGRRGDRRLGRLVRVMDMDVMMDVVVNRGRLRLLRQGRARHRDREAQPDDHSPFHIALRVRVVFAQACYAGGVVACGGV